MEYICKLLSLKIDASRTHLGIKKTQETTKDCYCSAVLCRVTNGNCYLGQGQLACTRAFCSNDICSWYICPLLLSRNSLFFIMFINQSKLGLCCLTLQMGGSVVNYIVIYVYDVPLEISQSDCLWPLIFQFSFVVVLVFFFLSEELYCWESLQSLQTHLTLCSWWGNTFQHLSLRIFIALAVSFLGCAQNHIYIKAYVNPTGFYHVAEVIQTKGCLILCNLGSWIYRYRYIQKHFLWFCGFCRKDLFI